jgi:membrane protein implicated in regulation of membrane protease activity
MQLKLLSAIASMIAAAASLTLATHYPLTPVVMTALELAGLVTFFTWPQLWLLLVPALLPVIGLTPWTGWITFEELDILILAVVAGGYARVAWPVRANTTGDGRAKRRARYVGCIGASAVAGIQPTRPAAGLLGMGLGLAGASLATIWERNTLQDLRVPLKDGAVSRGDGYAPRLPAFSMAMASPGGAANLADVALTGAGGRQLLANGDFLAGLAHWFFSSDRHHMPRHIKSLFMNVLFDQGLLGADTGGQPGRLCRGRTIRQPG